jgi:hypothetical protein
LLVSSEKEGDAAITTIPHNETLCPRRKKYLAIIASTTELGRHKEQEICSVSIKYALLIPLIHTQGRNSPLLYQQHRLFYIEFYMNFYGNYAEIIL